MKVGSDITAKPVIKEYCKRDGTTSIYLQCFVHGHRVQINTGIYIEPRYWSKKTNRVKATLPEAVDYNLMIEELLKKVHDIRVKVRLGQLLVNKDNFKEMVTKTSINEDFLAYMEWKIDQRKKELAYNTFRQHRSCYLILKEYAKVIAFSAITDDMFKGFKAYLQSKGNGVNTISNKLKICKVYLNLALDDGFEFVMPKKSLKVTNMRSKVDSLSKEQLDRALKLYHDEYLPEALHQTLRCFLFGCFTGLRFSDIERFTHDNVVGRYIVVTPQKTKHIGKIVKIPLTLPARNLLDFDDSEILGRVISNQKTNDNLKIIARYIGVDFKLSFHSSRHTFATIFLESGGNIEVLKELLGHSTITQTMVYTHVADKRKEQQMGGFESFIA